MSLLAIVLYISVAVSIIRSQGCFKPVVQGFASCGEDTSPLAYPFKTLIAATVSDCARQCLSHIACKGLAVEGSSNSRTKHCELFAAPEGCHMAHYREGYKYYQKIASHRYCLDLAPPVQAAVRVKNTYVLFYDDRMQSFRLDNQGQLYAIACPVSLSDYWYNWKTDATLKAATFSTVYGKGRIFFIKGSYVTGGGVQKLHGYQYSQPYDTISNFFGANVSDNVLAVTAQDDLFNVYTENGIHKFRVLINGTSLLVGENPPIVTAKFNWMDLSAAALTPDKEVTILFIGNQYFLFNTVKKVFIDQGHVCINRYNKDNYLNSGLPFE